MAFRFNWPGLFSPDFIEHATARLEAALNGGGKPAQIVGTISVKELHLGTQAPELEMLEIGELAEDKFRGMFKLTYGGDAYLVLQMSVQANPLPDVKHHRSVPFRSAMVAANKPLVVPMQLSISNLKLRGVAALVVDRAKGATLTFKNDPLDRVDVSSTFDNVANIRRFLQNEIERQLRKLFTEDLPALIHSLSLHRLSPQSASSTETHHGRPVDGHADVTFGADGIPIVTAGSYSAGCGRGDSRSVGSADSGYHSEGPVSLEAYRDVFGVWPGSPEVAARQPVHAGRSSKWVGNEAWEAELRGGASSLSPYALPGVDGDWAHQEVLLTKDLADMWRAGKMGIYSRRVSVYGLISVPTTLSSTVGRMVPEGGGHPNPGALGLRVALGPENTKQDRLAVWRRQLHLADDDRAHGRRSPPASLAPQAFRKSLEMTHGGVSPLGERTSAVDCLAGTVYGVSSPGTTIAHHSDGHSSLPTVMEARSVPAQQLNLLFTANRTLSLYVRPSPSCVAFRTHPRQGSGSFFVPGSAHGPAQGVKAQRRIHRFRMPAKPVQGIGLVPTGSPRSVSSSSFADIESVKSAGSAQSRASSKPTSVRSAPLSSSGHWRKLEKAPV